MGVSDRIQNEDFREGCVKRSQKIDMSWKRYRLNSSPGSTCKIYKRTRNLYNYNYHNTTQMEWGENLESIDRQIRYRLKDDKDPSEMHGPNVLKKCEEDM